VAVALAALSVSAARAAEANKYVPADAEAVIHVNVKQILGSPLAKKHLLPQIEKALKDNQQLQQVLTLVGLDPLKDINGITISNAGQKGDKVLVVFHGKFNADKINTTAEAVAKDKKGDLKIIKIGGKNVYESAAKDRTVYSTLVDGNSLLVSTNKDYIAAALGGKTGRINQALKSAAAGVDAKQSVWGALVVTDEIRKSLAQKDGPGAAIGPKLKAITGGVNITDGIAVAVQVQTSDAKAARELREFGDQAKGLLAFVGAQNEEVKPFTDELLKTLKISAEKTDVNVSFKLSGAIVEKAVEKLPQK
jgi:hypothetical protein